MNKNITTSFWTVFFRVSILFGLGLFFIYFVGASSWLGLKNGFVSAIFMGFFFSLTIYITEKLALRTTKPDLVENSLGMHQVQTVLIDKPYEQIADKLVTRLECSNFKIQNIYTSDDFTTINLVKNTLLFPPQRMRIALSQELEKSVLTVSSQPSVNYIFFDGGQSIKNVRNLVELVNDIQAIGHNQAINKDFKSIDNSKKL